MTDTQSNHDERQYDDQQSWREVERRRVRRTRRTLVAVLVVLVILLLIASYALIRITQPEGRVANPTEAKGITWVRSIYGWGKGQDQQFWGPQGVNIGPDSTIWVTTQGQNRVVGFSPDGSPSAMLYQGPNTNERQFPNALSYPVAVATDPSGLIYIADGPKNRVWVMTRDNRILRSIYVPNPSSLAVNSTTLVVGSGAGFVIMSPAGEGPRVIGKEGKGIDQFSGVRGLAIGSDGTIYVVDQYNNRLSAYDKSGNRKWIISLGSPGNKKAVQSSIVATTSSVPADMQIPAGMTIDGAGRLVIADPFGFDLTVLNPKDGRLIAKYGAPGTIDGQFVYPSAVSYDPQHDWFAVTDTQNARVQIVRLPGSGGSASASANRALAGPLRACIFPLALIILAIIGGIVYRVVNRRKKGSAGSPKEAPAPAES